MAVRAPKGLGRRGAKLWRGLVERFEFDLQEVDVLLETCRTLDVIDELTVVLERDGLMTVGSTGQPVVHPAVAERRAQQAAFARLVASLNVEAAEVGAVLSARSTAARTAAQRRWRDLKGAKGA
jgi:hypothetical protein